METNHLADYYMQIWNESPVDFPVFTTSYSPPEKRERERLFTEYSDRLQELRREGAAPGSVDNERFFRALRGFMKNVYDFSDESLDMVINEPMISASREFYRKAKAFDQQLTREEIFQAMRNVWIMNGLQLILGLPVKLTPSILAYSLLYPYSDNLLDDPMVSSEEKVAFCQRFERCLRGERSMGDNHREQAIAALVEMISMEFPGGYYPGVHQSLLAIHRAQNESIRLINSPEGVTREEITRISFDKGGTSVLADGYLVAGTLTPEISRFCYGYGVWLQLADDIQDVEQDQAEGNLTLFSSPEEKNKLGSHANRTFHFGRRVMEDIKYCDSDVSGAFGKVMLKSIELMILQSVGLNHHFFPVDYCGTLESHSPLGFSFLQEIRKKSSSGRMKLISSLIETSA